MTSVTSSTSSSELSPFLKWVGGKNKYIDEIVPGFPEFETYYEPFIGGGAIFFYLKPRKAYISDINIELINCYQVIRSPICFPLLLSSLDELITKNNKEEFLEIRKEYNQLKTIHNYSLDDITSNVHPSNESVQTCLKKASYFIYLNKTGFRGIYRENKKGQFNVPFGNNNNLHSLYNKQNLENIHHYLSSSDIQIRHHSYKDIRPSSRDFVYFDPPYDQESSKDFVAYTKDGFQQKDLYEFIQTLPCSFVLSNAPTPKIKEMYSRYPQRVLSGKRSVDIKKIKTIKDIEIIISSS